MVEALLYLLAGVLVVLVTARHGLYRREDYGPPVLLVLVLWPAVALVLVPLLVEQAEQLLRRVLTRYTTGGTDADA